MGRFPKFLILTVQFMEQDRERQKYSRRTIGGAITMSEEIGKAVDCVVCGRRKKPAGRSAPIEMANSLCDHECEGYYKDPQPGYLWPNETREDFGY